MFINSRKSNLIIKAPIDGKIKNFSYISNGQWINNTDELMGIVKYGAGEVVGFVSEDNIERFKLNSSATFIPFDGQHDNIQLTSKSIDQSAVQNLPYLSLSSNYGGPIAVRSYVKEKFENRPESAFYMVNFKPLTKNNPPKWQIPGYVHVDGYRYSPFIKFIKNSLALIIRESSF